MARRSDRDLDARLQRRVQRYGWDKAVHDYEAGWRVQLEPAQSLMLALAAPRRGERVLDVACGTGLISFRIADAVGEHGAVVGTDISGEMVEAARRTAIERGVGNAAFERFDAEDMKLEGEPFDAAVCGLGLMYLPDPVRGLQEMRRLLKPGGRAAGVVWGRAPNAAGRKFSQSPMPASPPKSARCFFILAPRTCWRVVSPRPDLTIFALNGWRSSLNL
jgi:SAM-dependent methyltransferase